MKTTLVVLTMVAALTACGGSGSSKVATPAATTVVVTPSAEPSAEASQVAAPTLRGNAATNPACKLLSLGQVATAARLNVTGILGLPSDLTNPAKRSESCTWYLDSKNVQSSLVVQYTVYARPPTDIKGYYPQVIAQGFGKTVPKLGDISKIYKHALDTVYKRAEIHVTLLTHAEATAEDQAASIAVMRLLLAGIRQ
jgi:hypothetical protein